MIKLENIFVWLRNFNRPNTEDYINKLYKIYEYIEQLEDKLRRRNLQIKDLKKEKDYLLDFVNSSDFLQHEFQSYKMERPYTV